MPKKQVHPSANGGTIPPITNNIHSLNHTMRYILLALTLFIGLPSTYAQLEVSYWGNTITRPGLQLAFEVPLGNQQAQGRNQKRLFKGHLLRLEAGRYLQPRTHTNSFLGLGWQFRTIRQRGFKFETGVTLAYSRIKNKGATFEDIGNGQIEQVPNAGRGYFLAKYAIGMGKDLRARNGRPLAWHIRPSLAIQLPYNTTVNVLPAIELGISYYFGKRSIE